MSATQAFIRKARDAFLEGGVETPGVRSETLEGWRRSRAAGVSPDGWITPPPPIEIDSDSRLLRAVRSTAQELLKEFEGIDIAIMAANRDARIIGRWAATSAIEDRLERMGSTPGVLFDETVVGTTGLSTPLETGKIGIIDGAEHYRSVYDSVVAVGAPIVHAGTGVVQGVIDLIAPTGIPIGLIVPHVVRVAEEAGNRLSKGRSHDDRLLLAEFSRIDATRRGPVMALNSRLAAANRSAAEMLGAVPRGLIWAEARRALTSGENSFVVSGRPGSPDLKATVRQVAGREDEMALVVEFAAVGAKRDTVRRTSRGLLTALRRDFVGRSEAWRQATQEIAEGLLDGRPLVLFGPAGSGTSELAAKASSLWSPAAHICTPSEVANVPAGLAAVVVDPVRIEDVPSVLAALTLRCTAGTRITLVATGQAPGPKSDDIIHIHLPGLDERVGDVEPLVAAWTSRSGRSVDPDAVRELSQRAWPRNVKQLFESLDRILDQGESEPLPHRDAPRVHGLTATGRPLSYLEALERKTIAGLLRAAEGRKVDVASELGTAHSTLYRKLDSFGIPE